jgi:hypothetical protein
MVVHRSSVIIARHGRESSRQSLAPPNSSHAGVRRRQTLRVKTERVKNESRVQPSELEQTKQILIKRDSNEYFFALRFSRICAQLAAFHMTLGEQNMGRSEVFVDHPTCSAQWSFRARVRNREATYFTPNFTLP